MGSLWRWIGAVTVLLAALSAWPTGMKAVATYTVTDLGQFEEPTAINENDDVVGYRNISGQFRALLWQQGQLTDFGTLGGNRALFYDINNAGQIAGVRDIGAGWVLFVRTGNVLQDLGPTASTGARINNNGDVVGQSAGQPVLWAGSLQALPVGSCSGGNANDINDSRLVVGWSLCGGTSVPVAWQNGTFLQLPLPVGVTGWEARRVNAAGQIAGYGPPGLLFFEPNGQGGYVPSVIGALPGTSGCAPFGINDLGTVVGVCGSPDRAVIWDASNGLRDLNALADLPAGVVLDQAYGITNDGVIVARGFVGGQTRAYLLSPFAPNRPPTAVSGSPQTIRPGGTVQLDGSGSYDDNTPTNELSYSWTFASTPEGSLATLNGAQTITPSFVPDVLGAYRVRLIVTDQGGLTSAPSDTLVSQNSPPAVSAGPDQVVIVGSAVSLEGTAVDDDGDSLTFEWSLTLKPNGSNSLPLSANSAATSFIPDLAGTYIARLVASDVLGAGAPDEIQITATTATNYSSMKTQAAAAAVVALGLDSVTTGGNQNALTQFLARATAALDAGNLVLARQKLQQAVERTDGCALNGVADQLGAGRDWVTTCDAQDEIYSALTAALGAITE